MDRVIWLTLLLNVLALPLAAVPIDERFDWERWRPMDIPISYYSVLQSDRGVEFWFDAVNSEGMSAVVSLEGPALDQLRREQLRFHGGMFKDYTKHKPARETPIISRTCVSRLNDGSYVVLTQLGPKYDGGASELYPYLMQSATGLPKDWKILGPPKGEPKALLDEARKANKRIRCEGGRIFQLADGHYRMYIQGFGVKLAMAEASDLNGDWTFYRDKDGAIVDLLESLGGSWLFPYVMRIGEHGFIVTGGNKWPPKRVDIAYSVDGRAFAQATDRWGEPMALVVPTDVLRQASSMKALRGVYDERKGEWFVVANVWDKSKKRYETFASSCDFPIGIFKEF